MKLAVSSKGENPDSPLDERFGRAPFFIVYDLENDTCTCIDNKQNYNSPQGAGIQSAQNVVNAGAGVVITGNVGPKAFQVLKASGVKVCLAEGMTVKEAINMYKQGRLSTAETNNIEGHWV
ncbi:MAG: NifB/NifX family molybdenum-iron cluster-binding protein [Peptococcaceae bacterium]|nr:NifB/NifX family molybdenum-iron cluster-binding protein [Peptococcaceae bacterium]MDH7524007.1 NifB/NifX family molybdenum-iron cluster-binding protein [Peptococcaceae bacterium]